MRRTTSLFILFLALVMGGIAAYLANNWLRSHAARSVAANPASETIVVANFQIPFGTPLSSENVREIAWPAGARPQGAYAHVGDLLKDGRRLAISPFVRDEPIVSAKVTAPNASASMSTIIQTGMRAVTVPVDDVKGVAGFISPGDYVDVALTRNDNNSGPVSEVILQHVKVLAIDQTSQEHQDTPKYAKLVTLEVTQEQALKILLAVNVGKLSMILRQASEVAVAPQSRVTTSDLFTGETPTQVAVAPPPPSPPVAPKVVSDLTKVTVTRSMRSEDYQVPKDNR
jgi:pilus assembly protein CpaB